MDNGMARKKEGGSCLQLEIGNWEERRKNMKVEFQISILCERLQKINDRISGAT